ncbi:aldo/keto reductase [Chromobacterium subtsugae]|uniref:aldo/keto reductase n=1 Tax=Chromobacterium subtsugae TaxID=251747 RepID=UPI0006415569|nr:aldo/keto reductase [Chromobacterium subtsugae]
MQKRTLGRNGPQVSALGLGCMGMSAFYGPHDDAESLATLDAALDLGVNFLDTADMYGPHTNERLLAKLLARRRGEVVLATKFGIVLDPADPMKRGVNGRPEYVRASCEGSLQRLGVDHIDLYYQHRIDPAVPIEETVGAMADLVRAGKVRYLGLSEASPATLRRAAAVHPIHALQSEYSLWTRDPEDGALAACREVGASLVAYSPLGRGFLTGAIQSSDDFAPDDFRRHNPRFQGENFQRNLDLVAKVKALAADKGCSPAQLALAWLLAQGEDIVAIPGARKQANLRDNLGALSVSLDGGERDALAAVFADGGASGARYAPDVMQLIDR